MHHTEVIPMLWYHGQKIISSKQWLKTGKSNNVLLVNDQIICIHFSGMNDHKISPTLTSQNKYIATQSKRLKNSLMPTMHFSFLI